MDWSKVSISNWLEYYKSLSWETPKDVIEQLDQNIERVSYLTGQSYEQIEELTASEIAQILKEAQELPTTLYESFEFKGRKYVVDKDPTKYKAGRYMSVMNAVKDNAVENLHRILFVVCREVDDKGNEVIVPDDEISSRMNDFKELPMLYANPIAVFFYLLSENLMNVTLQYLADQAKIAKENLQVEIDYLQDTAG